MTEPVRRAGVGRRPDGTTVTWTVAEGRRGRRWRESVVRDGAVAWSLLYETDADGRFSHLELASPAGLATLHPEGDGTVHGNVVDADGVHHVRGVPFPAGTALIVTGSTVGGAAVAWAGVVPGEGSPAVELDPASLAVHSRTVTHDDLASIDADGAPVLDDAMTWSTEDPAPGRG